MKASRKKSKKLGLGVKKKTPDKPHGRGTLKGALIYVMKSIMAVVLFVLGCVIENLISALFHNYFYENFTSEQRAAH
jgi:hypothetical protein